MLDLQGSFKDPMDKWVSPRLLGRIENMAAIYWPFLKTPICAPLLRRWD